ncbi:MAG: hypothetical protein QOJ35_1601 [Solirubrobacteraceae bacterium]|jgi:hypothetical protein|nr:hypothetical protein [Solirubrobacteraceae bacterium]
MAPRTRPALALALAALGALLPAACGGGSGSPSGGDAAAQRARFIADTDALCRATNIRTKVLNDRLRRVSAPDDEQLLRRLAPILEQGSGSLRDNAAALRTARPPAADARAIDRIRTLYDQQAELAGLLAAAAAHGRVTRFKALSEQQKDVVSRARALTRAYGFRECGSAMSDAP